MSNKAAETHARMLAAIIIGIGEIASITRETLEYDQLTLEKRRTLQAKLATSIRGISSVLEQAKPGAGEALTLAFYGYSQRDGAPTT